MAVACFIAVVCLSVVKIYPDVFKHDNSKAEIKIVMMKLMFQKVMKKVNQMIT
ncbi:hypothetical protein CNEO3_250005 [Clostridium neonatale]|uniref:Uncharacterized protein n=1 Tax=Clostridium neonatale TaxID=137838 RepID=A0AA86JZS0_9CLOT|nr:hypothetical protein CNEO_44757 [Clostridium neonatale]CAI3561896.1 hypothetical protein CNEO4_360015 [Clostridium neonatale]CAI3596004.1 hypothetical protein CNEO3_10073 [Clostridium neonatale]CAI3602038.1 hypothetical protein CNEO3_250005 [Clostridium neonatale]CAI3609904.1 hypothetical protein CNEO3_370014 [Clostridium neonatale]